MDKSMFVQCSMNHKYTFNVLNSSQSEANKHLRKKFQNIQHLANTVSKTLVYKILKAISQMFSSFSEVCYVTFNKINFVIAIITPVKLRGIHIGEHYCRNLFCERARAC